MLSDLDPVDSQSATANVPVSHDGKGRPNWLKMGAIAAASALAGGLAAAWFYRKTLANLQTAANSSGVQDFDHPDQEGSEDT